MQGIDELLIRTDSSKVELVAIIDNRMNRVLLIRKMQDMTNDTINSMLSKTVSSNKNNHPPKIQIK